MKKIFLISLTIICVNFGFAQSVNHNTKTVKIKFPEKKYIKTVERNFYNNLWIGGKLYAESSIKFDPDEDKRLFYSTLKSSGYKYEKTDPKLFKFKYVPVFRIKKSANNIKQGQPEYDVFELSNLNQIFLVQYKGEFVGFASVHFWNPLNNEGLKDAAKQFGLNVQQDTTVKATYSIYTEYKKQKGRVFYIYGLGTNWLSIDKNNKVWAYYPYENLNLISAYDFINKKIEDVIDLTTEHPKAYQN